MQQSPSSPGWQGRKVNTPEVRHRWEKAWTSIQNKEFQAPFKKYRRNLILLFIAAILLWLVFVYLLSYAPKKTPVTLISLKNYQSPVPLNLGASQNENGLGSLANLQFLSADGSQKNTDKWQDELAVLTNPNKNQFLKTVKDSFQEDHSLFFKLPRTRIIYINGYAAVNQSGEPCLVLTADNPLKEESWFKLRDLLEELDQATQNKTFQTLLVFDCVKEQENWKLGIVDNNWSESLGNLLEHEDFSGLRSSLTVLCSTSSDEFSHFSPQLGSSVFSHFFKLALAGLADKTNPSGKLPTTFPKSIKDTPAYATYPGKDLQMDYEEGLYIGYRWYDKEKIDPLFPFGHGLSYTSFEYSNLRAIPPKGSASVAAFEFEICNTGDVAGKEIVQGYVKVSDSRIDRPRKELKKFTKISLEPGETQKIKFELSERELSFWNIDHHAWQVEPAEYIFEIGASANDIRGSASVWLG